MNYDEAIKYLFNIPKFSKKTTNDNTLRILNLLDNPQNNLKVFHVAGTNGKGSVCAFLHNVLEAGGIKAGLFTSPHLVKANERIKIGRENINDDQFLEAFLTIYNVVNDNEFKGIVHPSFFEFIFLMALIAFRKNKIEYAVIEVGLGGRLDATNIVDKPLVSIITSISLEHTEVLGDTIEKIAFEKAGIIKHHVPVIFYASSSQVENVIRKRAIELGSEYYPLYDENIQITKKTDKYIDFSMNCRYYDNDYLRVPFPAAYQTINGSLAMLAFKIAANHCKELSEIPNERVIYGLSHTVWEGRMESIEDNVFIDGAHNISGVEKFVDAVLDYYVDGDKYLLFSVVKEKRYKNMIDMLTKRVEWKHIYISSISSERAMDKEELKQLFLDSGAKSVSVHKDIREAFEIALKNKNKEDVLFCAGSLYLVGEIKEYINEVN